MLDPLTLWRRYKDHLCECPDLGICLDISRMTFGESFLADMEPALARAYEAMRDLEAGEIANPDENRMVGHYWLRAPELAPTDELRATIEQTVQDIERFAEAVHSGALRPPEASGSTRFTEVLLIGIGGSALGPQLVSDALGDLPPRRDRMRLHFMDNTDPDGFDRVIADLGARIKSTLVLVVSKSGGTPETRNGMVEAQTAFARKGLDFAAHAVAVTSAGSTLDRQASGWLRRFPMWDWVGGRTSVTSAVGLLPAALQGLDIRALLAGAAEMDALTRQPDTRRNPAALMALMWHHATAGRGAKDLVILPYKDRLLLMSRYLQQLIMESLGKELDLSGQSVNQGISVYGNKGSTDQHAFVQQLRDGLDNFFVTFITVTQDRPFNPAKPPPIVEPGEGDADGSLGVRSGDYLQGLYLGTRQALFEKGRQSMTIAIDRLDARSLGALIALYERTVGFYATLVNVNAYHQPGVEAGKKAAASVLATQRRVLDFLKKQDQPLTAEQVADRLGTPGSVEVIHHLLERLSANRRGVAKSRGKFRWKG